MKGKMIAEDRKGIRQFFLHAALSLLGTYGLCYIGKLAGFQNAFYTIFSIMIFLVIWWLLEKAAADLAGIVDKKGKKRRIVFASVVSCLFSLSMVVGYQLQAYGFTESGFAGKGFILLRSACVAVAIFPFGNLIFKYVERIGPVSKGGNTAGKLRPAAVFGICAGVVFVLLIPVWLAYYPIIMSYDFHRQVNEAYKGLVWFNPYQPIAHTWIIWVFMQLGNAVGSYQTGYACMAVFQMLLYALVTGYACSVLYRIAKRVWPVVAGVLFFGLFPLNSVQVVCTTKDVIFSILFLLFFLLLMERCLFATGRRKVVIEVFMVLEGSIMTQFRNNAFYAVAVFVVLFLILVPKKEKLRVLVLSVLLIAGCKLTGGVIKLAIGTELGVPQSEAFSVPIQQMLRIGYYHGDRMDYETSKLLERYQPREAWGNYDAPLADGAKGSFNGETLWDGYGDFLSDWFKLGLKYPNEYLDAFLELTRGYWFWDDVTWAEHLGYGLEDRMGAIFTYTSSDIWDIDYTIEHESKLPWLEQRLEEIVSANSFYDWPLVSILFKPAFYMWGLLLVTASALYRKQKQQFILTLFPWVYFGTMAFGPVVQLRYAFPIMMIYLVAVGMLFVDGQNGKKAE